MSSSEGSWLGTSANIERITHSSSADSATWGKSSLTSMPLLPCFLNLNIEGKALPVLRSVRRFGVGSGLPAFFCSAGLGSKVSTCEGPPFMNRWSTRRALGGKCGRRGVSGLSGAVEAAAVPSIPAWAITCTIPSAPIPIPQRCRTSRRVRKRSSSFGLWFIGLSIHEHELVRHQQRLGVLLPGAQRARLRGAGELPRGAPLDGHLGAGGGGDGFHPDHRRPGEGVLGL